MSDTVRLYLGKDIEIAYDTERCIHAAECTRGLPAVFDNSRRPWIQPDGASANAIAAVIAMPERSVAFQPTGRRRSRNSPRPGFCHSDAGRPALHSRARPATQSRWQRDC